MCHHQYTECIHSRITKNQRNVLYCLPLPSGICRTPIVLEPLMPWTAMTRCSLTSSPWFTPRPTLLVSIPIARWLSNFERPRLRLLPSHLDFRALFSVRSEKTILSGSPPPMRMMAARMYVADLSLTPKRSNSYSG